ncbi:MAG TPA: MFS transporter [Acetobacteraceae bacterium]|nr:MFS transporter [Acetobacteraceae bacterium]
MIRDLRRLHYGFVVAGVTFLVMVCGAGIRSVPGVLIVPLEAEFHWSAATISFAIAINLFLYGLAGPFGAALLERIGIRRGVAGALALIAIGVGLTPFMRTAWQLVLLWGVVVGTGSGVVAMTLGAMIATRWFTARRGVVMGVLTASSATGQLVFLPPLASLAVHHGWRATALVSALAAAALVPVVLILMRDRPQQIGLPPYGESAVLPAAPAPPNAAGRALAALASGLRSRDFWLLAGSFFVCGASTNGLIGTHLIPACVDHGIPEVTGASLLAAIGVFDLFGTTGSGWLTDRVDSRALLAWYYGLRGLSLLFLPFAFRFSFWGLSVFAVFYGLDWVATVPPTVRLATNAFGRENAPIMFGWIAAAHQLGAASVAFLAGLLRADYGTYLQAFLLAGVLCLVASLMVTFISPVGIGGGRREAALAPAEG